MAFVYCDKCDWQQDDFWTLKYNPVTVFLRYVKMGWKPVYREWDCVSGPFAPKSRGHNWVWLAMEFKRMLKRFRGMHWHTARSWQKAVKAHTQNWPPCPKCGECALGVD